MPTSTPRTETSTAEDPTATGRPRPAHQVVVREDGHTIWLPGARAPIPLRDALTVWDAALCAQTDPELFFPERGGNPHPALQLCASCPVQRLCLATFGPVIDHGVVGGTTEPQRRNANTRRGEDAAA